MPELHAPYPWLAARARNALRRRMLVGVSCGVAFIVALLGLVLIPREATHVARSITTRMAPRPDTSTASAALSHARSELHFADSSIAAARRAVVTTVAAAPPAPPQDTLSPQLKAERDSLSAMLATLNSAMARASESPLPPAFKALGETPVLQGDAHVRVLLDSLDQVDKLREPFGALGAGDPIYVALTARVNEIGRAIRDAASVKRSELRARIAPLTAQPVAPAVAATPAVTPVDTSRFVALKMQAARDSASAQRTLDSLRTSNARIDTLATEAREVANVGAPPIAMLAAALVIALAVGFGVAFLGELRNPRIAHVREGETVSGVRALAVIEPTNLVERARRQSDVDAPPLIDIVSESYRTLYLHLAATDASVPIVTVTGDLPAIVATIAANLAAVAAYEARSTLLVDADPASNAVASVLRIQSDPGLTGILSGNTDFADAVVSTTIGRDRPLDVLPSGHGRIGTATPDAVRSVRETLSRLERRYDFVVMAAPTSYVQLPSNTVIPVPDVVICAQVGVTRLSELRAEVKSLRGVGRYVHGIVLWDEEPPRI